MQDDDIEIDMDVDVDMEIECDGCCGKCNCTEEENEDDLMAKFKSLMKEVQEINKKLNRGE